MLTCIRMAWYAANSESFTYLLDNRAKQALSETEVECLRSSSA
jgi:hypothetical protein